MLMDPRGKPFQDDSPFITAPVGNHNLLYDDIINVIHGQLTKLRGGAWGISENSTGCCTKVINLFSLSVSTEGVQISSL